MVWKLTNCSFTYLESTAANDSDTASPAAETATTTVCSVRDCHCWRFHSNIWTFRVFSSRTGASANPQILNANSIQSFQTPQFWPFTRHSLSCGARNRYPLCWLVVNRRRRQWTTWQPWRDVLLPSGDGDANKGKSNAASEDSRARYGFTYIQSYDFQRKLKALALTPLCPFQNAKLLS